MLILYKLFSNGLYNSLIMNIGYLEAACMIRICWGLLQYYDWCYIVHLIVSNDNIIMINVIQVRRER